MDTSDGLRLGGLTKEELRVVIAEQWERIVAAGPTGDDMAVTWLTEAIWARRVR